MGDIHKQLLERNMNIQTIKHHDPRPFVCHCPEDVDTSIAECRWNQEVPVKGTYTGTNPHWEHYFHSDVMPMNWCGFGKAA